MGLKSDIEEVTNYWKHSPWRIKIFLALSLFLSTSSIASLSESIIKWKWFILDALTFYRQWISTPAIEFLNHILPHKPPGNFFDSAVLLGLFIGSLTRSLFLRNYSKLNHTINAIQMIGIYSGMLYLQFNSIEEPNEITVLILYPLFVLLAYYLTKGAERILTMAYMITPALCIGVAAAITIGIAK